MKLGFGKYADLKDDDTMKGDTPTSYNADLLNLPPALQELTDEKRWVIWSWEQRQKKGGEPEWTKATTPAAQPG